MSKSKRGLKYLAGRLHVYAVIVMLFTISASVFSEPVEIYTEDYPPYNYLEGGEVQGMSTEIIRRVMELAEVEYSIGVYPWARAMIKTEATPNSFIYSMRRLPSRENRFIWVGAIVSSYHSVFALKNRDDIEVKSLESMKEYEIGTTIYDSRETLLINAGFPVEKLTRISGVDSYRRNYMKLVGGRIDLWPIDDAVAYHISQSSGDVPEKTLKRVYSFNEGQRHPYYFAANVKSDKKLIEKIQASLAQFSKTQEYADILKKWGVNIPD